MKLTKAFFGSALMSAMMVGALSFTTACSSTSKKQQAQQLTPEQQVQQQQTRDRDAFIAQTQARIDQLNKYAQDLLNRAASSPKPQSTKMENAAEDLDFQLKDARKQLTDVRTAAPQNWVDEKRGVERSMDRAESQYSNTSHMFQ
jgi:hypothetical protein